jgi:glyceraldehyde 3-phosphate dehydrogenase
MGEVQVDTAVNGLGRIGMPYARQVLDDPEFNLLAMGKHNDPQADSFAQLLKFDTVHGEFTGHQVAAGDSQIIVDGSAVAVVDTTELPDGLWSGFSERLVLADCSGVYLTHELASRHLKAGAMAVVLSAPAQSEKIPVIIPGVTDTEEVLDRAAEARMASVSSCSTNCIAPIIKLFHDAFPKRIEFADANVVHARTSSQLHLDGDGKSTAARRSADNLVDYPTGSDREIVRIFPDLLFDSHCTRTPVADGSKARISFEIKGAVTEDEVVTLLVGLGGDEKLQGIIDTTTDDITSASIIGKNVSSRVDLRSLKIIPRGDRTVVRMSAWFDNEWGYTNRVREVAKQLGVRLVS